MSKIVILNSWLSFKFYSVVLVIYFCIRMIAKLTDLKQHILLLISVAQVSECSFSWVLFLQVSEAAIMVPGGVPSHVRFGWKRVCFPAQRGCLQNLVPCRLPGWGPYLLLTITPSPPCFVALSISHEARNMVAHSFKTSETESPNKMGYNMSHWSCSWCQLSPCSHFPHCLLNPGLARNELKGWKKMQGATGTADTFILSWLMQQP